MYIEINWNKEKVIDFLKVNLSIGQKILSKINEGEIDGEALTLLSKNDLKKLGIKKVADRTKILSNI